MLGPEQTPKISRSRLAVIVFALAGVLAGVVAFAANICKIADFVTKILENKPAITRTAPDIAHPQPSERIADQPKRPSPRNGEPIALNPSGGGNLLLGTLSENLASMKLQSNSPLCDRFSKRGIEPEISKNSGNIDIVAPAPSRAVLPKTASAASGVSSQSGMIRQEVELGYTETRVIVEPGVSVHYALDSVYHPTKALYGSEIQQREEQSNQ
jgi:hypothetical protein